MKAKKFEQQFDDGVNITASLNVSKARRVLQAQKRVNVDLASMLAFAKETQGLSAGTKTIARKRLVA